MTHSTINGKMKKILTATLSVLFWIAVWQLAYSKVAQELLLVSPAQAFMRLFTLAGTPLFWQSVTDTCFSVVVGFLGAVIAGTLLASISARFYMVGALLSPFLGVIRSTPVASFIILALLWIKTDMLPVFIAFLMVTPMVWSNIYAGIKTADKKLLEMAKIFRLSKGKVFKAIYIPSVMPHFVSACSTGIGFAWKSAIAAEVICRPATAIGRQLYNSQIYLETADLFAWTIAVIFLSVILEKFTVFGVKRLEKRLNTTRGKGAAHA